MSTNCAAFSTTLDYPMLPTLAAPQKTAAITRVRYLERQVFDEDGRQRRGIKPGRAEDLVSQINQLRHDLGWLEARPSLRNSLLRFRS